jgi:HK97 family phage prohead protease
MRTAHASLLPLLEAARAADDSVGEDRLVRRSFGVTVRALNTEERSVQVVVSTDSLDAHGDVVDQDWNLKRYKRNPVVLWSHNNSFFSGPEADLPIGYAKDVAVRDGQLEATLIFVDEKANPMAEKVWQGFRQKSLHAVSAGFRPHTVSREVDDDFEFYRLSDNELYEISVCPIPANPDAVAKSKALAQLERLAGPKTTKASTTPVVTPNGAKQETSTMDLEQRIKELEASAAKHAEAMSTTTKALETANAQNADLKSKLEASEKSLSETTAKLTEATAKIDAESKRAKAAEDALITSGVDALVGKKIEPAERDELVELALSNKALFDRLMAKRAPLPTAVGKVVIEAEKGIPTPPTADSGNGDALAALIDKQTNFAPLESFGLVGEDTEAD